MIKWKYKPSGNCPVQAEGYFLGWYFYFRLRWNKATIEFSKTEAEWKNNLIHARYMLWTTKNMVSAGWLSHKFCLLLVYLGCLRFFFKLNKKYIINKHDFQKEPYISDDFQIGYDGAYEHVDKDLSNWNITLMDKLKNTINRFKKTLNNLI